MWPFFVGANQMTQQQIAHVVHTSATHLWHLVIYATNGALFSTYTLAWNVDKIVVVLSAGIVLLYFDRLAQGQAAFAPRRQGQRGGASVHISHTAQAMTLVTVAVWLAASLAAATPIPVIGAVMWGAMVLAILIMPQQRDAILWRCKTGILTYALGVLGFVMYLRVTQAMTAQEWAAMLGSTGEAQNVIANNRGLFITIGSWMLWLMAPLGYLSILIQRFTVNPLDAVAPWKTAGQIIAAARTRQGEGG